MAQQDDAPWPGFVDKPDVGEMLQDLRTAVGQHLGEAKDTVDRFVAYENSREGGPREPLINEANDWLGRIDPEMWFPMLYQN